MVDLLFGLPPINRYELVGRCVSKPELKEFERRRKRDNSLYVRRRLKFMVQHYSKLGHQTLRMWVDCWDPLADWLVAHDFGKGDAVWIFGKILSRSSRHGGPAGTFFYWIHCYNLFFIPEVPRAKRTGDKYLVDAEPFERMLAMHNSSGPPEVSYEQYQELLQQLESSAEPRQATPGHLKDLPPQDLEPT